MRFPPQKGRTLRERFDEKWIEDENGCWIWLGCRSRGYGQLSVGGREGRMRQAHILSYEMHVGPIPEGLQLDHLCRVRHCVNPAHVEPVTCHENLLRGDTATAKNSAKTHCPKGHPYDDANTHHKVGRRGTIHRVCRACGRDYQRTRKAAA